MYTEQYKPPRSYLDMARAVIDTQLHYPKDCSKHDAEFGLVSCTYVYSYMAIAAFVSEQLFARWNDEGNSYREKYPNYNDFREMMRCENQEIRTALKELCCELEIKQLHETSPNIWQRLNEFLKRYRDWFVHPTPEDFHRILTEISSRQWDFASNIAVDVIGHFFDQSGKPRPDWLKKGSLVIPRLKVLKL